MRNKSPKAAAWAATVLLSLFGVTLSIDGQELQQLPKTDPSSTPFLDACFNTNQWPTTLPVTGHLGYWDNLNDVNGSTLSSCFANMNAVGLQLSIESDALDPPACGSTGAACYNAVAWKWQNMRNLGGPLTLIRMQEPYTKSKPLLDLGTTWDEI